MGIIGKAIRRAEMIAASRYGIPASECSMENPAFRDALASDKELHDAFQLAQDRHDERKVFDKLCESDDEG